LSVLGYNASQPGTPAETQDLADWLARHQLTSGMAGDWEGNVTTLASGGKGHLAPLHGGGKYADPWNPRQPGTTRPSLSRTSPLRPLTPPRMPGTRSPRWSVPGTARRPGRITSGGTPSWFTTMICCSGCASP